MCLSGQKGRPAKPDIRGSNPLTDSLPTARPLPFCRPCGEAQTRAAAFGPAGRQIHPPHYIPQTKTHPARSTPTAYPKCACSSVWTEHNLAEVVAAGSNPARRTIGGAACETAPSRSCSTAGSCIQQHTTQTPTAANPGGPPSPLVAQMDRAPDFESGGWRFEPSQADCGRSSNGRAPGCSPGRCGFKSRRSPKGRGLIGKTPVSKTG